MLCPTAKGGFGPGSEVRTSMKASPIALTVRAAFSSEKLTDQTQR